MDTYTIFLKFEKGVLDTDGPRLTGETLRFGIPAPRPAAATSALSDSDPTMSLSCSLGPRRRPTEADGIGELRRFIIGEAELPKLSWLMPAAAW
jgi:hypothetical protein